VRDGIDGTLACASVSGLLSFMMGGATWQSRVNRDQVLNGKRMLRELIPVFIELMFAEGQGWGAIYYPDSLGSE
jgi:hypothetical protein